VHHFHLFELEGLFQALPSYIDPLWQNYLLIFVYLHLFKGKTNVKLIYQDKQIVL
jgi:hypothetical protein